MEIPFRIKIKYTYYIRKKYAWTLYQTRLYIFFFFYYWQGISFCEYLGLNFGQDRKEVEEKDKEYKGIYIIIKIMA